MFKESRKIQAVLAAVTLASLTFITAPAANAAPAIASVNGNSCTYDRDKTSTTVTVSNYPGGCKEVLAGGRYVTNAGNFDTKWGKYSSSISRFTRPSGTTLVNGKAQVKVPWGASGSPASPVYTF